MLLRTVWWGCWIIVMGVAFPSKSIHRCRRNIANLRVTRDVSPTLTHGIMSYNIGNRAMRLGHPVGRSTDMRLCGFRSRRNGRAF